METFSALLALCAGNSPVIGELHICNMLKRLDCRKDALNYYRINFF